MCAMERCTQASDPLYMDCLRLSSWSLWYPALPLKVQRSNSAHGRVRLRLGSWEDLGPPHEHRARARATDKRSQRQISCVGRRRRHGCGLLRADMRTDAQACAHIAAHVVRIGGSDDDRPTHEISSVGDVSCEWPLVRCSVRWSQILPQPPTSTLVNSLAPRMRFHGRDGSVRYRPR